MSSILHSGFSPQDTARTPQRVGAALTVTMHLLVLAAVLLHTPARQALVAAAPIMVEFITVPKAMAPGREPALHPGVRTKATPAPDAPHPASLVAPVAAPEAATSTPMQAPAPRFAPAPALPAVAATTSPALQEPVPVPPQTTQPVYNADTLDNPAPPYPAVARRNGEQGRVLLRVHVTEGGTTDQIQVRTSSGFMRLDDAARDTVLRWKFIPARRGAEPVAAWVLIPISFRLEG